MGRARSGEEREQVCRKNCQKAQKQAEIASSEISRGNATAEQWSVAKQKWKHCSDSFNELGVLLRTERENFEEAIKAHEDELRASRNCGSVIGEAIAFRNIGENYLCLENFKEAVRFSQKYLDLALKADDAYNIQLAYHVLGRAYWVWAESTRETVDTKHRQALEYFRKSLPMLRSQNTVDRDTRLAGVLMNMGNVCCSLDLFREGQAHFEEAEQLASKLKDHTLRYQIYLARADIYRQAKEFDLAEKEARQCVKVSDDLSGSEKKRAKLDGFICWGKIKLHEKDYLEASKKFKAAHKLKVQEDQQTDTSKNLLKNAHRLYVTSQKLQEADCRDHKLRRKLYEKMGDTLSSMEYFGLACLEYQNMLEETEDAFLGTEFLKPCYVSLAQTYSDAKDFTKSLTFHKKLKNLERGSLKEEATTCLNIAECSTKISELPETEVIGYFEEAADLAEKLNDQKLTNRVYGFWKDYLELEESRKGLKAYERVVGKMEEMGGNFPESESVDEEEEMDMISDDGDSDSADTDTILEDLESSDEELPESGPRNRISVGAKKKVKRNVDGESGLHIAAREGDMPKMRILLRHKGLHLVNDEDHNGWRPLHEAANHGHVDAIKMLLDAGAEIDVKGGDRRDVTPLMDAAGTGEIESMRALINRGAKLILRDHNGYNAADLLCKFLHDNKNSDDPVPREREDEIRTFLEKLDEGLQQVGNYDKADRNWDRRSASESGSGSRRIRSKRKHSKPDEARGVEEYKKAMSLAGRKKRRNEIRDSDSGSEDEAPISAFVSEEIYRAHEDWLEDDLTENSKGTHRKSGTIEDFERRLPPLKERRRRNTNSVSPELVRVTERSFDGGESVEDMEENTENFDVPLQSLFLDSPSHRQGQRDYDLEQAILIESDSEDVINPSPPRRNFSPPRKKARQTKLNVTREVTRERRRVNYLARDVQAVPELDSQYLGAYDMVTTQNYASARQTRAAPSTTVRQVKIQFMGMPDVRPIVVPVAEEEQQNSVKWLTEEAAKRFSEIHTERDCPVGIRMVFDGADLAETDKINWFLDSLGDQVLFAEPSSWTSKGITIKYTQICNRQNSTSYENVKRAMDAAQESQTLDLKRMGLLDQKVIPVFKALQGNYSLKELILNQNTLTNTALSSCCAELGKALTHLVHLETLSLVCTGITDSELQCIASDIDRAALPRLKNLNLSQNRLGDDSWRPLKHLLSKMPNLMELTLRFCHFTHSTFRQIDSDLFKGLERLKSLDMSRNVIGSEGVKSLCLLLRGSTLTSLKLTDTVNQPGETSQRNIHEGLELLANKDCFLENLDLSGLPIGESSEIGTIFKQMKTLSTLRLEATNFTPESLVNFMAKIDSHPSLKSLDLSHCERLGPGNYLVQGVQSSQLLYLALPFVSEQLKRVWMEKYGLRAQFERIDEGSWKLSVL